MMVIHSIQKTNESMLFKEACLVQHRRVAIYIGVLRQESATNSNSGLCHTPLH